VEAKGENYTTPRRNPAMNSLVEMFFDVDDFYQEFLRQCEQLKLTAGIKRQRRLSVM
jgi:hypothetical protein